MVLAAGLGTRLQPLTNDRPKALVEVGSRTMLELTLARLKTFGIHEVIINVHHFADIVVDYLRAHQNFGMHIQISREATLLDTGGGLKQAAWFFEQTPDEPFVLHNVDILSSFNLEAMHAAHRASGALATLAVQQRTGTRQLLFDDAMQLQGRASADTDAGRKMQALAFAGIHILSPALLAHLHEPQAFSIITAYLRLAAEGALIRGYQDDAAYWCDLGRPESVIQAAADLERGTLTLD